MSGSTGFPVASENPFAVAMPLRIPVNDPAPTTHAKKSISESEAPASFKSLSATGINSAEWRIAQSSS